MEPSFSIGYRFDNLPFELSASRLEETIELPQPRQLLVNHDLKDGVRGDLPTLPTGRLELLDLGSNLIGTMPEAPTTVGEACLDLVRAGL